jgi:hypothetical protein
LNLRLIFLQFLQVPLISRPPENYYRMRSGALKFGCMALANDKSFAYVNSIIKYVIRLVP